MLERGSQALSQASDAPSLANCLGGGASDVMKQVERFSPGQPSTPH